MSTATATQSKPAKISGFIAHEAIILIEQPDIPVAQKIELASPALLHFDEATIAQAPLLITQIFGRDMLENLATTLTFLGVESVIGLDVSTGSVRPAILFKVPENSEFNAVQQLVVEATLQFQQYVQVVFRSLQFVDSFEHSWMPLYKCNLYDLPPLVAISL